MTTPPGDSTPPPEHGPVALVARLLTVQLLAVIGGGWANGARDHQRQTKGKRPEGFEAHMKSSER